ncbi:MAG: RidA family protein [Verrucomicrobia bacterium]|nr:RidA family protein [Verrucomicrobiota bacterium]
MKKQIDTLDAPKAIGPYSQAVATEQFLFVSGQIPVNPKTGKIDEMTIQWQTSQVFRNIEAILIAAGLTFGDVVKVEVFLKDMNDFQILNGIYAEKFDAPIKPARQTVQVARLPMDALIEISCIAVISGK